MALLFNFNSLIFFNNLFNLHFKICTLNHSRHYFLGLILCLSISSYSQSLQLVSTPIGGGNFNIQTNFTGNSSCVYSVTITCPTCTPTTSICTGVTSSTSCVVTLTLSAGSNDISATATRTAGAGPQCPNLSTSLNVLPVEFSNFNVSKNKNTSILSFATASETNNDFFAIERSSDGTSFDAIGEIKGAGNSNTTLSYEFTDEKPLAGVNYYRIKQTDYDGKFSYTDIKSLMHNTFGNLNITPRTTEGRLEITTDAEDYTLNVYNVAGQQVKSYPSLSLDQSISIDELTAGLYFIKVNVGGQVETTKIVKL